MLIKFLQNQMPLSQAKIEQAGMELFKYLASCEDMTYQKAWYAIDCLRKIADEAEKVLNWNAGVEMKNCKVNFVIDKNPKENG